MRAAGITRRVAAAATAAILVIGVLAGPALGSTPVFQLDFPKGQACAGFALHIDGYDPVGGQVYREFTDRDDNVIRTLAAGTGWALTFSNPDDDATLSLPSNGGTATN